MAGAVVQVDVAGFDGAAGGGDPEDTGGTGDASFEEFVAGASGRLFTTALLLTGLHRAEAEDLLQDALERTYRRWRRITRTGVPEPYVRQVMVNAAVDRWRRGRRRPEKPLAAENGSVTADHAAALAERDLLLRALAELPSPAARAPRVTSPGSDWSSRSRPAIRPPRTSPSPAPGTWPR